MSPRCRGSGGDAIRQGRAPRVWRCLYSGRAESVSSGGFSATGRRWGNSAPSGACAGPPLLLFRMGRCVLPNLSARTHIGVWPGRGRADAPDPGPASGASGVRRAEGLLRALRRRTPAPSRRIRQRIS